MTKTETEPPYGYKLGRPMGFEQKVETLRYNLSRMDWTPDGTNAKQGYQYLTHTKVKGNISHALISSHVGFSITFSDMQVHPAIGNMGQHYVIKADCVIYDTDNVSESRSYTVYGESADAGDKGISKAQTNAFKNFWANEFMLSFYTPEQESYNETMDAVLQEGGSKIQAKKEAAKEAIIKQADKAQEPPPAEPQTASISDSQKSVMEKIISKARSVSEADLTMLKFDIATIEKAYNDVIENDNKVEAAGFIRDYKRVMTLQ